VAALGASSRNSSKRFGPSVVVKKLTPVTFASGRARLLTRPEATGSLPAAKTIGILPVAALAARSEKSPQRNAGSGMGLMITLHSSNPDARRSASGHKQMRRDH
jgi:hypothetical protein